MSQQNQPHSRLQNNRGSAKLRTEGSGAKAYVVTVLIGLGVSTLFLAAAHLLGIGPFNRGWWAGAICGLFTGYGVARWTARVE